jgi:hypothetical protein
LSFLTLPPADIKYTGRGKTLTHYSITTTYSGIFLASKSKGEKILNAIKR